MESRPLLIFDLDGARFAVDARQVRESVWLPELTPVEEAPFWVVGIFSLRGRIVPVADLHLRFGHSARPYHSSDQVVVVEMGQQPMGLVVSEVCAVTDLAGVALEPPPQFDDAALPHDHLVVGEVRVGDDLVTLLDVSQLTHLPEGLTLAESAEQSTPCGYFCPQATQEVRALFHARAMALQEEVVKEDGERLELAVLQLDNEYFGVELTGVQEFCDIVQPSSIPCCPPHILGIMNLRGDLLTLIDPRTALNLPHATRDLAIAVIARLGEQVMGIAVDAVPDVISLRLKELQAAPLALREQCGAEIIGIAPYGGRMMTVLDLPALLARPEWVVNENV